MADDLDFLTVDEAAAALRVQVATIRAWILKRKLPAFHAGRRVLIKRADLLAMVKPLPIKAILPEPEGDNAGFLPIPGGDDD